MIRVILWDVDGTLLNFRKPERYGIRKCFSLFGLGDCSDAMLERYSAINKKYWEKLERGEITKKDVLHDRFQEFFEEEKIDFDRIDEFNVQYQISLGDKIFYNDDSYHLVKELKSVVKQYAVSNGTLFAQERKLKKSGFNQLLDGIFISEQVGIEKPDRRFFDAVWNEIGDYKKEEVVIVGDSLTSDMQGGVNTGIQCCWYNPYGEENKNNLKLDAEIRDLNEIKQLIYNI